MGGLSDGSGSSPSGGSCGLMKGSNGISSAVVSSPKCRLKAAEFAAAALARFSGGSSSDTGNNLASSVASGRVRGLRSHIVLLQQRANST